MRKLPQLAPIVYRNIEQLINLRCFADTLVYLKQNGRRTLVALRFGGYPEQVRGLSDAIFGGSSIETEIENHRIVIYSFVKGYRKKFTHDGIYAEATITAVDDDKSDNTSEENEDDSADKSAQLKRKYIFCDMDDKKSLFSEIDSKVSVPLIPEFADYLIDELIRERMLVKLEVLSTCRCFDAYMLVTRSDERDVIDIVNRGLSSGNISIPNASAANDAFKDINSVSGYLNGYGTLVAEKIRNSFLPIYDPAREDICTQLKSINANLKRHTGYELYPAQLAVAEAVKRRLDKSKIAMVIAECGSGKTKIGSAALAAHQNGEKCFNVILSPSHVTKKWVREIHETLPNTRAAVIHSITELDRVYDEYLRHNETVYVILSKERARDGYMKRPAVRYSPMKMGYVCPNCGEIIREEIIDDGAKYMVTAKQYFFKKENDKNHKCEYCGSNLWTVCNPQDDRLRYNKWVKIGGYGFVYRDFARAHLSKTKDKAVTAKILNIANNPNRFFQTIGAYRRFSLSEYIAAHIGRIDGLICDELHQYKGDSGQGNAMAKLVGCAKKVIGMTATLINGYSSGIFYLLYRIAPNLMLEDDKPYNNPTLFNSEYGVVESVYELQECGYNDNSRTVKRKIRERQLPGVSPLVYSRFLMESAVFLSLNDMGKELPDYEEIPVKLAMTPEVKKEYERIESTLTDVIRRDARVAKKILSRYLGLLSTFPDQPYGAEPIYYPKLPQIKDDMRKTPIIEPEDILSPDELHEKDYAVLDIVERKVANGERVLIYTNWVKTDTQSKLLKVLTEKGYRADILRVNVTPDKREKWVESKVNKGLDVLITNPSLVETGLDLNAFTTLIYYNIGYNLFTFRQSSRRSWRINQTAPRIEVYMLYYEGTMQARAMKLMASKLSVATIIEGNLSDEGLSAMSECQDMTTLLAKELTLGIKSEMDDISEAFKKMAIIHEKTEPKESLENTEDGDNSQTVMTAAADAVSEDAEPIYPQIHIENILSVRAAFSGRVRKSKRVYQEDPNQISLFDLLAG